jgi:16S rRNA uridine-516 pseudouridylate synthase and related pseudouridylate synthases
MTIHQGVYHQVKRMLAAVGNKVEQLHRAQIGALALNELAIGEWTYLDAEQVAQAKFRTE